MKRTIAILGFLALILAITIPCVKAIATIRIWPPQTDEWLNNPATFEINVTQHTTYDPYILLVMTTASWHGLTGNVTVTWTDGYTTFSKSDFKEASTGKIPPATTTEEGCRYTIASLRSHLGVPETEPVYWANASFLWTSTLGDGIINQTAQTFTVNLPSTDPRMLVYALGKTATELFDNCVPPTIPGFVIPEPATIVAVAMSFVALIGYAARRRKH